MRNLQRTDDSWRLQGLNKPKDCLQDAFGQKSRLLVNALLGQTALFTEDHNMKFAVYNTCTLPRKARQNWIRLQML